jgi:hypothetical protein
MPKLPPMSKGKSGRRQTIRTTPDGKVVSHGIAGKPIPGGGLTNETTGKGAGTRQLRGTDAGARRGKGS